MTETTSEEARVADGREGDASADTASSNVTDRTEYSAADRGAGRAIHNSSGSGSRVNFWLDIATALTFCAMVGSGVLLEFVLVRRGGGTWLGLARHDWGEVHFWLAAGMLTLVVVHLVLHRAWIARCWRRFAGSLRSPVTWMLLAAGLALMLMPLLVPVQPGGRGQGYGRGHGWVRRARTVQEDLPGAHPRDGQGLRRGRGRGRRGGDHRRRAPDGFIQMPTQPRSLQVEPHVAIHHDRLERRRDPAQNRQ
jgi:hypothetical protein